MERDFVETNHVYTDDDFNSRAHVERDSTKTMPNGRKSKISTHALTWSATKRFKNMKLTIEISTHALTWSATIYSR